jgi:hypothetical protein
MWVAPVRQMQSLLGTGFRFEIKQEILGVLKLKLKLKLGPNLLLTFNTIQTAQKARPTIILLLLVYSFTGNGFTQPLPSNDKDTQFFLDFPIYLQSVEIHSANSVLRSDGG